MMQTTERQFVVNSQGERVAVLLNWERYEKLLEAEEELDAIRAYDEAKACGSETIPLAQALASVNPMP